MKSDCLPSSQKHLWTLCPITAKPRDNRLYLLLFPDSCEDQGSCCSLKTQGVSAPRASGRRLAWDVPPCSVLHIQIFFPASPALSKHRSSLLGLGEHFWVIAAGAIGGGRTPSHPVRVCKFSGLPAALAAAAASWGRTGGTEQGVSSPRHSCTGALCGFQEQGMAALSQMEDGTLGVLTVCCFAAPKKPEGCFVLLLCCYALNCTKPHVPLCYPRRWMQMTPLLTCV